jgi:hypothetical protein
MVAVVYVPIGLFGLLFLRVKLARISSWYAYLSLTMVLFQWLSEYLCLHEKVRLNRNTQLRAPLDDRVLVGVGDALKNAIRVRMSSRS